MFGVSTKNWNHPTKWKESDTGRAYAGVASYGLSEAGTAAWEKAHGQKWGGPDAFKGAMSDVGGALGLGGTPGPKAGNFHLGNAGEQQFGAVADTYANRQIDPAVQQMLLAQANGSAPSAAQIQMEDSLRRNQAMAHGLAYSNANISPAQAQRMAMQSQSQMGLQSQAQFGAMRAQEQAQGQQMLANYQLNQQSQNDQMVQYFHSLGFSRDEAVLKAQMAMAGMAQQNNQANQDWKHQLLATGLTVGGGVAGAYFGGPVGGAVGAQAGGAIANQVSPQQPQPGLDSSGTGYV